MSKAVDHGLMLPHARPMFRNLLVAIFLMALALPAFAMPVPARANMPTATDCNGTPVEYAKGGQTEGHMQRHDCIGCIASCSPTTSVGTFERLPFVVTTKVVCELDGTIPPPSIPPPRD